MKRLSRQRLVAPLAMLAPFIAACGATTEAPNGGDGGIGGSSKKDGGPTVHVGNADATTVFVGDGGSGNTGSSTGCGTTISGKIFDPAGKNPLYGVVVFATNTSPLPALPAGASCASCDSLYAGVAIEASTVTDATGSFTLTNPPSGSNVTVVAQVGKWRRQFSLNVHSCTDNPQADGTLTLPKNGSEGDIPQIAVSTGAADTLECMLGRVGLDDAEYTGGGGGTGHIHIFQGGGGAAPQVSGSTATSDSNLWDSQADLMPYDVLLLSCEGQPVTRTAASMQALEQYTAAGGRAFMSHYHYDWLNEGPFGSDNLADWSGAGAAPGGGALTASGTITTTLPSGATFDKGEALKTWLGTVKALTSAGTLTINSPRYDAVVTSSNTPSQTWITTNTNAMYFSFDTPVGGSGVDDAGDPTYCGRAVFSDLHVSSGSTSLTPPCSDYSKEVAGICVPGLGGSTVPSGCGTGDLSAQEKALEFMLFDLSSCVVSDTKPPPPPPPPPQ